MSIQTRDQSRVLNTLRYISASPTAAGRRTVFLDPFSNVGHYSRPKADAIKKWHPAFLKLAAMLDGCAICHWGSQMLKQLLSRARARGKKNKISPGQQKSLGLGIFGSIKFQKTGIKLQ